MDHPEASPEHWGREYWAWFGFWAQFIVFAGLTILGLAIAGDNLPGDEATGLLLAAAAVALAFMRLRLWLDGGATGWMAFLFVDTPKGLAVVIPLFVVIALAGLFLGAGASGSLRNAGISLFIVSGAVIFLSLKRVFDNLDAHR
jgi:uncharacterized membrane protein YhaH (DUF805 family)